MGLEEIKALIHEHAFAQALKSIDAYLEECEKNKDKNSYLEACAILQKSFKNSACAEAAEKLYQLWRNHYNPSLEDKESLLKNPIVHHLEGDGDWENKWKEAIINSYDKEYDKALPLYYDCAYYFIEHQHNYESLALNYIWCDSLQEYAEFKKEADFKELLECTHYQDKADIYKEMLTIIDTFNQLNKGEYPLIYQDTKPLNKLEVDNVIHQYFRFFELKNQVSLQTMSSVVRAFLDKLAPCVFSLMIPQDIYYMRQKLMSYQCINSLEQYCLKIFNELDKMEALASNNHNQECFPICRIIEKVVYFAYLMHWGEAKEAVKKAQDFFESLELDQLSFELEELIIDNE